MSQGTAPLALHGTVRRGDAGSGMGWLVWCSEVWVVSLGEYSIGRHRWQAGARARKALSGSARLVGPVAALMVMPDEVRKGKAR